MPLLITEILNFMFLHLSLQPPSHNRDVVVTPVHIMRCRFKDA